MERAIVQGAKNQTPRQRTHQTHTHTTSTTAAGHARTHARQQGTHHPLERAQPGVVVGRALDVDGVALGLVRLDDLEAVVLVALCPVGVALPVPCNYFA